jgi:hypothetical protein
VCGSAKKKRKEGLIMKKIVFAMVVLMLSVPSWAEVRVYCEQVGTTNEVVVKYDATSEPNLVRGFGLDVWLDNDSNIFDVNCGLSVYPCPGGGTCGYYIYPGGIQINAQGEVTDYGSCRCDAQAYPGTLGDDVNEMTTEQGSLYAPTTPGSPNAPGKSGDLYSFKVDKNCNVSIAENSARGGVVMESPDEVVDVNCVGCTVTLAAQECMKNTAPEYSEWDAWGKPKCWCYQYQCRGDVDGLKVMLWQVQAADLELFRQAFYLQDAQLQALPNGICADLDHTKVMLWRVQAADLDTFRMYFYQTVVPSCDMTNYNFWEVP